MNDPYAETNFGAGNKWVKNLTSNRLDTFVGGRFGDVNLSSVLFTAREDDEKHVKLEVWSAPGLTKPSFEEAMKSAKWKPAKKGEKFGPSWSNHWWKVTVFIPSSWSKYERVQFEFDHGCEAMVFTSSGHPLQGITGGFGGDRRVDFIIPPSAREEGSLSFVIESSCNGMFGVPWDGDTISPPAPDRYFTLASADLVVPNQEAWRLMWDFETLKQISRTLPGNTSLQNKALTVANAMMNAFEANDPSTISKTRAIAAEVFGEDWESLGENIYSSNDKREIWGIGHCHIDSAWLWPYSVTQQKVARSWSTQIDLINRYPEHRFAASSAQQYKWLKELYPTLFKQVQAASKAGTWEVVGGSWVENDGNMPSGEALVRQMLYGQRFFQKEFGKRCTVAWLPDSFGYNGAYPQLFRSAGMKYFFTQKLSWNNINVFPHSTFNWSGIDGTQVLCHMTPVDTYTAQATVGDVNKGLSNHKNLESNASALLVFGNGDGGGGPLSKMLENLRRIKAASRNSREIPVVSMGTSTEEFFKSVEAESKEGISVPVWHGELYFEFHRGTFTSHGSIKRGNRKSEILMRDLEHLATLASIFAKTKYIYPKDRIDDCWEKLLLNQFHDVLPGSSIGMVYDDAEKYYAEISKTGKKLLSDALDALFPQSSVLPTQNATKLIAINTLPFARQELVTVSLSSLGARLKKDMVQISTDGTKGYCLVNCEGNGLAEPRGLFADTKPASAGLDESGNHFLRNESLRVKIKNGRIVSLYDTLLRRELIPAGQTGGLIWFEDRPPYWDAWDVEIHHLEKSHELQFSNVKVLESGPVRASLQMDASYGKSTIKVTISLDAIPATLKTGSRPLIVFHADVDWHQRHEFLKFQIPLDIHSDNATYEAPFGNVQRPTHKNTTLDMAKFEVCGHKYADLSEHGYGVALLSESKYGYSCLGNLLSISLLRAATAPDAEQDQGKHEFSWAVMPHVGHFHESDVPAAAHIFNSPLYLRYVSSPIPAKELANPVFSVSGAPNVFLETIKRGEDDDFETKKSQKTVVLRLYEAYGGHARATLRISNRLCVKEAYVTNILEDAAPDLRPTKVTESGDVEYEIDFRGFQVQTVKLVVEDAEAVKEREHSRDSWINVDYRKYLAVQ